MKKNVVKKMLKDSVIGTVITSLLLPSCSGYLADEYNADSKYGKFANDNDEGDILLDANSIALSETAQQYSKVIADIINDITTNKESAVLFCSNANTYLTEKNYNINIQLTAKEKAIIKAMTDEDIQQALRSRDMRLFLNLCKQKGYLSAPAIITGDTNYSRFFETEGDFIKYKQLVSKLLSSNTSEIAKALSTTSGARAALDSECIAAIVLLVVVLAGVALGVAVVVEMVLWVSSPRMMMTNNVTEKEPMLKLWFKDSSEPIDYDVMYSELVVKMANDCTDTLSSEISGLKKEDFKQFIILNLEKHYGLQK